MGRATTKSGETELAIVNVTPVGDRIMLTLFNRDYLHDCVGPAKFLSLLFTTLGLVCRATLIASTNPVFKTERFGGLFGVKFRTMGSNCPVSSLCRKLREPVIAQRAGPSSLALRQQRRRLDSVRHLVFPKSFERNMRVTTFDMKRLGLHDTTISSFNNKTTIMYRAMPLPRHLLAKTRSFSGVRLFTPNSPCQFRGWSTLTKNRRFPRRLVSPRGNRSTRVINSSGSILAQLRNDGVDTGST